MINFIRNMYHSRSDHDCVVIPKYKNFERNNNNYICIEYIKCQKINAVLCKCGCIQMAHNFSKR